MELYTRTSVILLERLLNSTPRGIHVLLLLLSTLPIKVLTPIILPLAYSDRPTGSSTGALP
ncbi:hypothetical protein BDV26DRAFT_275066, partial [Aspergillus bertholletiae]